MPKNAAFSNGRIIDRLERDPFGSKRGIDEVHGGEKGEKRGKEDTSGAKGEYENRREGLLVFYIFFHFSRVISISFTMDTVHPNWIFHTTSIASSIFGAVFYRTPQMS